MAGIGNRGAFGDCIRLVNNQPFGPFDLPDLPGLLLNRHKAVENPNPTDARHCNRHRRFGDRIHVGTEDRDLQLDPCGQTGHRVHILARNHRRAFGHKQHVIEGQTFLGTNFHRWHLFG